MYPSSPWMQSALLAYFNSLGPVLLPLTSPGMLLHGMAEHEFFNQQVSRPFVCLFLRAHALEEKINEKRGSNCVVTYRDCVVPLMAAAPSASSECRLG